MATTIALKVLTREGLAFNEETVSVVAPGTPGYLGTRRHHAPLVTTLQPGTLRWTRAGGERVHARLGSGLLEVQRNQITILTDTVSAPEAAATARHAG